MLLFAAASEPERLSIYAPQAKYSLPVTVLDGREYVGFFELIEPLATADLKMEGSNRWKLRIHDPKAPGKTAEAEFQEGTTVARVRGRRVTLSASARSENQRLILPLHGIGSVLMPLLGTDLIFHEAARRMFLGGSAELISSELHRGDPATLALHFPESVSPNITSDGNSLKLSFTRDPVMSFGENQNLNDKLFKSSNFEESNGAATLTINGSQPLLAKFSDGGRTILISQAPAPPAVASTAAPTTSAPQQVPPPPLESPHPSAANTTDSHSAPTIKAVPPSPTFLVVIDPAHGGNDPGARITPTLAEKDLTLSLARKLRQELQSRHIASEMLRDSDTDIALDQRAVLTNLARASLFISLHAEPATALRIYTPALPSTPAASQDRGGFLLWESAQGAFSRGSATLAATVADSFSKRELRNRVLSAFLQPLHSIAAPAIAVEAPADKKGLKISEDLIAGAIAEAVAVEKLKAVGAQ